MPTVFSRPALGFFALAAVILAAISFAVVDVSIANANGCLGVSGPCSASTMPLMAVVFAVIGSVTLAASVGPAMIWFIGTVQHPRHDADIEPLEEISSRPALDGFAEEDL